MTEQSIHEVKLTAEEQEWIESQEAKEIIKTIWELRVKVEDIVDYFSDALSLLDDVTFNADDQPIPDFIHNEMSDTIEHLEETLASLTLVPDFVEDLVVALRGPQRA